jgi:glycerol uptake facilitator-like aquaporin
MPLILSKAMEFAPSPLLVSSRHTVSVSVVTSFVRALSLVSLQLDYMTNAGCFFSEFFTTIILVFVILAILDKKSSPPPAGLAPLAVFLLVLGIGTSLGMQTSTFRDDDARTSEVRRNTYRMIRLRP